MIDVSEHFGNAPSEQNMNQPVGESPGSVLKAARERANLSPESVADQLNLTPDKVKALESDNYDKLASDVFAQGYIRGYSKIVGLDDDEMVEHFRRWRAATRPLPAESKPQRRPQARIYAAILIAAAVIVGVGAAAFFTGEEEEEAELNLPAEQDQPLEQTPANDAPWEEQYKEEEGDEVAAYASSEPELELMPELPVAEVPQQEPARAEFEAPVLPVEQETHVAPVALVQEETRTGDQLNFTFSEECWLEVRDASGQLLRAGLEEAGQSLALEGQAPFSVMLGNARAASVHYNGEPVAVAPRPGHRTARLTIGP